MIISHCEGNVSTDLVSSATSGFRDVLGDVVVKLQAESRWDSCKALVRLSQRFVLDSSMAEHTPEH